MGLSIGLTRLADLLPDEVKRQPGWTAATARFDETFEEMSKLLEALIGGLDAG